MIFYKSIIFLVILSLSVVSLAHDDDDEEYSPHEIKALKKAGKITSLERILDKLNQYDVTRLLEVELIDNKDHPDNSEYLYQIEYIDHQGMVLELEVDALTSQVLHHENEAQEYQHKEDD